MNVHKNAHVNLSRSSKFCQANSSSSFSFAEQTELSLFSGGEVLQTVPRCRWLDAAEINFPRSGQGREGVGYWINNIGFVDFFYYFCIQKCHHFHDFWIQKCFGPFLLILDPKTVDFLRFLDPEVSCLGPLGLDPHMSQNLERN